MTKEICISSTPHETRLAILEDDQLAEIYYERENEYTLAGSIYNGRVTRVLPGMQSAFVDVGLERDAFLYVTDFMELEDQEETDEIEKAAASGGAQAPREVRRNVGPDGNGGRGEARPQRPGQRPDQKQEIRQERPTQAPAAPDRQHKERRLAVEAIPDAADAIPQSSFVSESTSDTQEDSAGPGAKRWRGRRRRRGGRGGSGAATQGQGETTAFEDSSEDCPEAPQEAEVAPIIQAAGSSSDASGMRGALTPTSQPTGEVASAPRAEPAATPFVLPGESLSKYGGAPENEAPKPASAAISAQARSASIFKPATLIEAPIEWDGSGLLPGESISRHRARQPESSPEPNTQTIHAQAIPEGGGAPDAVEEEELVSERTDAGTGFAAEPAVEEQFVEEVQPFEEEQPRPVAEANAAEDHLAEEDELEEEEYLKPVKEASVEQPAASALQPLAADEELVSAAPVEETDDRVSETIEAPLELSAIEPLVDPVVAHEEPAPSPAANAAIAAQAEAAEGETTESAAAEVLQEPVAAPLVDVEAEPEAARTPATESEAPESDRDASHDVDPLPPSAFRLPFGLGGKKKGEEPVPDAAQPPAQPAPAASASAYAPGAGVVEEEIIEEEEFDAPRHPHRGKTDEQDLDDLEEETLPPQMRTGDLGEMLQEAHLDHRIQLNFDGKTGDEDEEDDQEDGEDESAAVDQPAGGEGQPQQSRDRGMRGRRGRGPQGSRHGGPTRRSMQTSDLPIISDLLKPGQEILVQIAKEPIAKKGARITSHIALPGRFLVFMPTVSHIGVSRKIAADEERQRLKRILIHERGAASGGFIVRTAAEGASEEDLRADLRMLINLWAEIKQRSDESKSPALIYHDLSLIERILRDQVSSNFSSIWVDSETDYERIVRFLNRFSPSLVRRVKLYTKETPLFEHFGIQEEISKALRSKVWLKSGGSIVINQTEALVAIDINTGKYVGKSARLEDTIVKTNLDAVPEIVRQIRLRDLGGIIVIDFIDMDDRKNRYKVMAALEEALKSDRAPTKVLQFNDFGLVAITRKRVKQSLERTLSVPCPTCQATGMVKSPTTVCNEIYTELRKMRKHFEGADVLLRVNPETVKVLKQNNASWLSELEELIGKNILVKSDPTLHPEQFDIQG
ncbi:MAG: Rne/Rng family ribonuclease [Terracidiphilus sp.]|jgi:ribonuclease G